MNLAFDIFPAATPLGTRLVRLTSEQLGVESGFRVELYGLGSGRIVMNRNQPECTDTNFADDNYVQVFDTDISDTIPLGGFFLDNKRVKVLSLDEEGGEIVQFGGPGALSYFGRQVWWNTNYVNFGNDAQFGPRADGQWHWYNDQYGDILERAIDEAQDADRPATGHGIDDMTHDFDGTNDSAGDAWVSFSGDYSIPVGTNYLEMVQRFRDLGLTILMDGELNLSAYQGFYGVDRTTATFATDKVLFINEDGGPVEMVNIVEELQRQSKLSLKLSRVLVKGDAVEPTAMVAREAASYGVAREGFATAQGVYATDLLQDLGDQALQLRSDSSDVPVFRHIPGQDALAGRYSPFPPGAALPALLLPRLYLTNANAGEGAHAPHATWEELDFLAPTRLMQTSTDATTNGTADGSSWDVITDDLLYQGMYTLTGTVVFTGGSVRGQVQGRTRYGIGISQQDMQSQMVLRLYDSSDVLKGTLLSPHEPGAIDSTQWPSEGTHGSPPPWQNRKMPASSQWVDAYGAPLEGSLTGVAGDYLLLEIGARHISGQDGAASGVGMRVVANQATDLPANDETQESNANMWIELWGAPTAEGAEWSYWIGDLVTLHTGTEMGDYNYQDLRVYAINWRLLENGEWWPEPELGGLIAGVQGTQVAPPPILGGGGGGGGVVTPAASPPTTLKKLLTNKSGGSVVHGDVVVVDLDNDESFDTTSTAAETRIIGIAQGDIANNATGYVAIHGYVELVTTTGSVTRGDYGFTSTTPKEADAGAARAEGAFCQFLTDGTAPSAILFGPPDVATGGGGGGGGTEMVLDYAQITSNASITATSEATADVVVTGSAITYDGATEIMVEFYSPFCRPDTAANDRELRLYLYDGSSSIGRLSLQIAGEGGGSSHVPVHVKRRLTPSAASHTYSIRASVNAGTGLVGAGTGGSTGEMPAFIRIVKSIPAVSGASVQTNEVRNFPSLENADDAQPEWWEESAGTATLTEVDLAGEGITESWERALKLVTTADVHALQTYTYADEKRLKSGKTVSCRVAVWSVGGVTARVRLQSTVGSLGVATTTAAAWTILAVEGVVLDGTAVDLRLEVNNGTAYFVPLAFGIGSSAPNELPPRGLVYRVSRTRPIVENLDGSTGKAAAALDITTSTSPLAVLAQLAIHMTEGSAGERYSYLSRPNPFSPGGTIQQTRGIVDGDNAERVDNQFVEMLDDTQNLVTQLVRDAGTGSIAVCQLAADGWWEWE